MITEERLAALEAQMAALVEPPTEYYTSRYSGEEIDKGIDGALQLGGASTPQGAIAALGAGVRPKLNDNPFFLVNQRGQSSYTVKGYTVDRWKMGTNTATLDILSDGVKITLNQAPSNDMRLLHQIIEDPQRLIGKTIIAAFYVTAVTGTGFRGGFRANSGTISYQYANITQPGLYTALFTVPSGCTELLLTTLALAGTPSGQSITILAATAEIGNTQTLAYQDDSGAWQLLEQPDPLEVLKCQRYQFTFANAMRIRASRITNSEINFFIPLPTGLRTTPTIVNAQNLQVYSPTGGAAQTGFAFSCPSGSAAFGNGVTIVATKSSHGLQDAFLYTNTPGGANLITLDANL